MKKYLLFFFILLSSYSFSQIDKDDQILASDIAHACGGKLINFHKAHTFFFNKQVDSSFFYSSQAYNQSLKSPEIEYYLNYIYGVTAVKKKFYTLAKKELERIPKTFKYSYLVDYNLASIALQNKAYHEALNYYISISNSNRILSKHKLKVLYHNTGLCYLHLKKYSESEKYLLKELEISQKDSDTLSVIHAKLELGNLFYEQYKDNKAISYYKEAYNLAQLFSNIPAKQNTAINMAIIEKNRKHYKESVDYYIEFGKWKDSLWNRDKISQLLEKDKEIAIAVKEKEIFAQKELAKKQSSRIKVFILTIIIILFFFGTLIFLYRSKIRQHKLINRQKKQLEDLNATKNYLFSVISHDLRSPVNALRKQHNTLLRQITNKELDSIQKTVNTTVSITENMHHLLNNVLHWALEQSNQLFFEKRVCALLPIIQHVLFNFESLAEAKQIKIQILLNDDIFVNVDKESLKIVLRNIIDNAIKYTPEHGKISIIAKPISKNECVIEIEDSGPGISKEQLTTISELKELNIDKIDRSKGIGLGLLLCTTLIRKNNGSMDITSKLNKGTKTKITLPRSTE